ncbi:MAG: hypothetical protein DMF91_17065 [Acidobacteria bacterium]|nr:MAG: hypothetical protein DMF91_17065 [Acidobacteriota bacterium]
MRASESRRPPPAASAIGTRPSSSIRRAPEYAARARRQPPSARWRWSPGCSLRASRDCLGSGRR